MSSVGEPQQEVSTVPSRCIPHWLQPIGKTLRIRLPRARMLPFPFPVFVVARIPTRIEPPNIEVDAESFEFFHEPDLVFFGSGSVLKSFFGTRACQERFHGPSVRPGEDVSQIPLGRLLQPEDLQGAAVFLASDASDMVTGHILHVDGGYLAK